MRYTTLLPLVASAATAFIIPNAILSNQIALAEGTIRNDEPSDNAGKSSWWDDIPSKEDVIASAHRTVKDAIDSALEAAEDAHHKSASYFESLAKTIFDLEDDEGRDEEDDYDPDDGHHGGKHGHHRYGNASKTIYELVTESKYTTKFAKVLEEYPDIGDLLKDTKHNITLFVPTDKAFDRIPGHHKDKDNKPSKEFILAALQYHIAPGFWPARRLAFRHTVPSELHPAGLGDKPQRLRVRTGLLLHGTRVNFFSRVVAADVVAKNGLIHGIDHVLIPPPPAGRLIDLLPSQFSTLALAFEKTGLGDTIRTSPHQGGTLFAPPNRAFAKLGPAANAFLFSPAGLKYLRALLRYHIVANETLYSDAYYGRQKVELGAGDDDEQKDSNGGGHWTIDLPSLLGDKTLRVDVRRWGRFISLHVNGRVRVVAQDIVAYDGVIQVVGSVLIPPHKHKKESDGVDYEEDEISVGDLVERLDPYLDGGEEEAFGEL